MLLLWGPWKVLCLPGTGQAGTRGHPGGHSSAHPNARAPPCHAPPQLAPECLSSFLSAPSSSSGATIALSAAPTGGFALV